MQNESKNKAKKKLSESLQILIEEDPILNDYLLLHDQFLPFKCRSINDFVASPKIDQSKAPINTMTASCATVDVSRKRSLTKRARLDENITFCDGSMNPARIMKSENKRGSFAPVGVKKQWSFFWKVKVSERLTDHLV